MNINLIANYIGQGGSAFLGIFIIPYLIRYLGIDSYAIISLFASFQSILLLVDFGLSSTIYRKVSFYAAGKLPLHDLLNILKSTQVFFIIIAIAIVLLSFLFLIISFYFPVVYNIESSYRIIIMLSAFIISAKISESISRSILVGLEKHILFNIILLSSSVLRNVGALIIVIYYPDIIIFFCWQLFAVIISLLLFVYSANFSLKYNIFSGNSSLKVLLSLKKYAGSILVITLMITFFNQLDKFYISYSFSLAEFGYYSTAFTLFSSLALFIAPIAQTYFPRFCASVASNNSSNLISDFKKSSNIATFIIGPVSVTLYLAVEHIVYVWSGSNDLYPYLAPYANLLFPSILLSVLTWIPSQMHYALGSTGVVLKSWLLGLFILLILMFSLGGVFDIVGVQISILLSNLFLFFVIPFTLSRFLGLKTLLSWYINTLFPILFSLFISYLFFELLIIEPSYFHSIFMVGLLGCISLLSVIVISYLLNRFLRIS